MRSFWRSLWGESYYAFMLGIIITGAIVLMIAATHGCAPSLPEMNNPRVPPDWTELGKYDDGFYRFIDRDAAVVCWYVDGYQAAGIECLPCSEMELDCAY